MPPITTRTLNPLPFDNLEPKRFEDLARQLAYEFKPWRQLEATGRTGSDDGFDARGFEIVPAPSIQPTPEDDEEATDEGASDHLWLIQCKRERSIGPAKMRSHLEAIPPESRVDLYGLIFVAACDFSKTTRDVLRTWCATHGIAECHIWGKAELEDMLYQPKNDNLLFAYFGISLQIRRQKAATNIRRTVTIKRKLKRLIEKADFNEPYVILRDPDDDRYPFTNGDSFSEGKFLWRVVRLNGLGITGLKFFARESFAYLDLANKQWDVATAINLATPTAQFNPWYEMQTSEKERELETQARHFWLSLKDEFMRLVFFISEINYENIIEIDDVGNDEIKIPTIFVKFRNGKIPDSLRSYPIIAKGYNLNHSFIIDEDTVNVRVFPDEFRDRAFEKMWAEDFDFSFSTEKHPVELTPPAWIVALREREAEAARAQEAHPKEPSK